MLSKPYCKEIGIPHFCWLAKDSWMLLDRLSKSLEDSLHKNCGVSYSVTKWQNVFKGNFNKPLDLLNK